MTVAQGKRTKLPFQLAICALAELPQAMLRFTPTHVISVTDPGDSPPEFPIDVTVLRLAFWDAHALTDKVTRMLATRERDNYPPNIDHARAILDFGANLPEGARVLVHCWAGVSRSTAAAFVLAAQRKSGDEKSAFDLIKILRPGAMPNRLIVKFADKLLGADGRMKACLGR